MRGLTVAWFGGAVGEVDGDGDGVGGVAVMIGVDPDAAREGDQVWPPDCGVGEVARTRGMAGDSQCGGVTDAEFAFGAGAGRSDVADVEQPVGDGQVNAGNLRCG